MKKIFPAIIAILAIVFIVFTVSSFTTDQVDTDATTSSDNATQEISEDNSDFVASGAELTLVQSGFQFTEGPTADSQGNVYFSDITDGKIYKWSWENNTITLYKEHDCQPNGLMFNPEEQLVICEMSNNRLTLDDMQGNISVIADNYNGTAFNSPNDLWIDAEGGIYFSDFAGGGPGADSSSNLQVYYIKPDLTVIQATDDLVGPNGLVGTPDGTKLYVTDPSDGNTWSYNINEEGTLSDKTLFSTVTTDGMTMDENGNLYFSGDEGIQIYSPDGELISEIEMSERCTNLEFAGPERKTLFITATSNIYTLEMNVKGAATALDIASGKE